MTKHCRKCNKTKPVSEFHRRGEKWQPYCKECKKANDAEYRLQNMDYFIERREKQKAELYIWYNGLKAKACTDCDHQYDSVAMHWDHLPGFEKVGSVSRLLLSGSKRAVLKEIAKCELVCANCHAIRTRERRTAPLIT